MAENSKKPNAQKAPPVQKDSKGAPVPDNDSDNLDGCDVAVTNATLDHDLPAADGGVA